jgi:hypothetical protein
MSERKPEWPEASELPIATIGTDINNGACTKLNELNNYGVTNVTNKGGAISYRREK